MRQVYFYVVVILSLYWNAFDYSKLNEMDKVKFYWGR